MDPLNKEFIRLLKLSGLTQTDAAKLLHVSQGVISQYVSGKTRPSETVLRLFRLETGTAPMVRETTESVVSDAEFGLIEAIRKMPRDRQGHFIRHAKGLAGMMEESRPYPKTKRKNRK